jgi:hypothetical protein
MKPLVRTAILIVATLFAISTSLAQLPQTKSALTTYNNTYVNTNGVGGITGAILNQDIGGVITSMCGLAQPSDCPLASSPFANITISGGYLNMGANNPSLAFLPTGNPATTNGSIVVQGTTAANNTREYQASFGLTSNKGTGASPSTGAADKVTLYTGMDCLAGSIACWSMNPLVTLGIPYGQPGYPSSPSSDFTSSQTIEADSNNFYPFNFGSYAGGWNGSTSCPNGGQCYVGGVTVTGSGSYTMDFAYLATGFLNPGGTANYQRGFVCASIAQHCFEDVSNDPVSMALYGSHTSGIDTRGATFSNAALIIGNAQNISAENAAGNGFYVLAQLDAGNNEEIGGGVPGNVTIEAAFGLLPAHSTSQTLGSATSGYQWSGIYGTVFYGGAGATAGVACSGSPSSSFATVGGIVTHC